MEEISVEQGLWQSHIFVTTKIQKESNTDCSDSAPQKVPESISKYIMT
jgi:hypothetical protein